MRRCRYISTVFESTSDLSRLLAYVLRVELARLLAVLPVHHLLPPLQQRLLELPCLVKMGPLFPLDVVLEDAEDLDLGEGRI